MTWPCLDEHPPDCLPPQTERVPPTRRRLLRTVCVRKGRKSQFHCDEQALTVTEVFCLTAGSVCAPTPISVPAITDSAHCKLDGDAAAMFGDRPTQIHRECTYLTKALGTDVFTRDTSRRPRELTRPN